MDKLPFIIGIYFAVISLVAISATICDKRKAVKNRSRISERTLMMIGILGGALFEYITMKIIRHKTLHKKFMIGLPCIILLQITAVRFAVYKWLSL